MRHGEGNDRWVAIRGMAVRNQDGKPTRFAGWMTDITIRKKAEQDLLFNWLSDTAAQVHPLPDRYHTDLAEAVCSGDIGIADAAIRHHIRYALNELLQLTHPPDGKRWRVGPKAAPPAL